MKIAFIYDAVYPFITGGAEKRVYELAKRLVQRGHDVHWYGVGWWWPEKGQKDIEMEGIHLHGVCKPMDLYNCERRSINEAVYFAVRLLPKLGMEKFDVIDCQGFPFFSCFTAKLNSLFGGSPLIITLHEVWNDYWYEYLGKAGFFGKLVEKVMVNLTGRIITVSKKTKFDLNAIKSSEKSLVIPNGIDFNYISKICPAGEKSDVIFAGRLIKEKNVEILIKAISNVKEKIPDIKCCIIGDGPERAKLEKLVQELSIQDNVEFKDFMKDYDNLISYMKSSEVFVLPSTREGFGIVVIEANACGLPVVVVDHKMNAASDLIINNKNGIVSGFSKDDIAENIINMINKKKEMQDGCIQTSKEYDWDKIVDTLEEFYKC
ncbi:MULTISPECIES: glycosyltransferase family 4 protein [Methanobacterium]|uniref:Glycosyl transferase family 1 n=1 Tax=Methanobacterium bryantii TaxID=2161 RepID=A0A2A2HAH7_METBR|nr:MULTISPECIES: glycosyltransferase family 4 protein [Methanobacterium]OEC88468.1 glycosyl transferase family 1 [Methanobacterium sp. A39]PAV06377.1 glycosyl transferase family 1 [Methanobacterium bryantii]